MMQSSLTFGLKDDHMSGELLKRAIERRGFKKKHVAERKGITPSTLARQLSGKHSLSLRDLREYTQILQCEFEELVVDLTPIKIIGELENLSTLRMYDQTDKKVELYPPHQMPSTTVGVMDNSNVSTNASSSSLFLFDSKHMQLQGIDPSCYKAMCFYKVTNNQLSKLKKDTTWDTPYAMGYVYPEPEGLYTVGSAFMPGRSRTNMELAFAAPITAKFYNPLSLGWQNAIN
jgi:transcriptional regulator with XRE-family HTH domain